MGAMRVGEVMTTPATTVPPEMTVATVAKILLDHGLRAVPVVEAGRLIGIITETDLLVRDAKLHFPAYLGILENVLPLGGDRNLDEEMRRVLAVTAREIMTRDVHTADPDDDLGDVAHEMVQRRLHAIPVVKRGALEGILFPSDVVRLIARDVPV
jgi:CBS domain-containing protein